MSANWSLVYVEASISDEAFFEAVQEAFQSTLENKLYGLRSGDDGKMESFLLEDSITEHFGDDRKRARIVQDGLTSELYGHGILHFPQRNNLHVIADSIVRLHVYYSGRMRRDELKRKLEAKPDPSFEIIFHMMDFLRQLTKALNCHAVHVMFERNPATRATGVHLYDAGELIDDYYYENLEAVSTELIEHLLSPHRVETLLGGRFACLTKVPIVVRSPIDGKDYVYYFDGKDLPSPKGADNFGLKLTDLYVPFWEDDALPINAIYCLEKPFHDYFLARYDQ